MSDEKPLSPMIIWKGPTGWVRTEGEGESEEVVPLKVTMIVDEVAVPTVEVGAFALDDAHLARLVSLVDGGCAVELQDRAPFEPAELSPGEMQEVLDRANQIRDTLGEKAAEEYIAERTGGAV